MYKKIAHPGIREEKVPLFKYNKESNVNYTVNFKSDNMLYNVASSEESGVYITEFSDYISVYFNAKFDGQESAEIEGDYEIVAVMEGYMPKEKEEMTIWKKEIVLLPNTPFKENTKNFTLSKDASIKLEDFNHYVATLVDVSKASSPVKLSVFMNVNLKAKTHHGIIEENYRPAIVLALNQSYFEIAKTNIEKMPKAVEVIKEVKLSMYQGGVIFLFIGLLLIVMLLVYLIFFTTGYKQSQFIKQVNKIFKKHGNRLVAIKDEIKLTPKSYEVNSFDDLIRISDELGKPIMYKYNSEPKNINEFWVLDQDTRYIFKLIFIENGVHSSETEKNQNSLELGPGLSSNNHY